VPAGQVVLVGHSLGGMTILEYAHRHATEFAARVAGVVLVSTSAEGSSHTTYGLPRRLAKLVRTLEIGGAGLLARTGPWRLHRHLMPLLTPGVRWLVFGAHAEAEVIRLAISMVGTATLSSIGGFRPAVRLHRRVDTLELMRDLPVAVLVGTRDRLTPDQCAETITSALPDALLVRLPDAGHMLPLERPDHVTAAIAQVCRAALTRSGAPRPPSQSGPPSREQLKPTAA
jgi:pimeloyl-ACP methyl ester carboxylesterase